MRLAFKAGVEVTARHFDPAFSPVFLCILEKWPPTDDGYVWVTAAYEDREGFHGCYRAIDVRTKGALGWGTTAAQRAPKLVVLAAKLSRRLGRHFDVVAHKELAGKPDEHIHIERDEKGVK